MCNINILLRKKTNPNITGFIQSVTAYSYINNNHGEGFYIDHENQTHKSKNKIDYTAIEGLNNSKIILTHQRLSTSGFSVKYNHPFVNKEFVLLHNGVINHFKKDFGSDTFGFWLDFNKQFKKLSKTEKNRTTAIIKILKELFKDDLGSYSIFLLDKTTNTSYYLKDSSTNINFYFDDDNLFITTEEDNKTFFNLISNKKPRVYDIKPRVIYEIDNTTLKVYKNYSFPQPISEGFKIKTNTATAPEKENKPLQIVKTPFEIEQEECFLYKNEGFTEMAYCENCKQAIMNNVYLKNSNLLCEQCLNNKLYEEIRV